MLYLEVLVLQGQVHDRFQEWRKAGVFKRMWIDGLSVYDKKTGIDWKWQAMDGVITKAPLGGKKHRTKSHRQSKSGTKRSILVDGKGVPLGVCVDGANRHDMKMTKATLQSIVIYRPEPTIRSKGSTCAWTKATRFQRYTNYWKSMAIQFTSD